MKTAKSSKKTLLKAVFYALVERPFLKENLTLITNGQSAWLEIKFIANQQISTSFI